MLFMAGFTKLTMPADALAAQMTWIETTGIMAARIAGGAEILGALGLILPSALRIVPKLTSMAAAGLVAVMLGAIITHGIRAEFAMVGVNLVLASLAGFVAWGRAFKAPIEERVGLTA